ncbi:MAG: carbohydrate binding family 9 domain-containing protein [Ignavibacteriales bacterium]|nr:carbohydrate binding family 9 domain-containing protein [Ignavibacteriales bacterium]
MKVRVVLLGVLFPAIVAAQKPSIHAVHITEPIAIDGVLSESAWAGPGFSAFKQKEPNQGEDATERTEVWIAYDDAALYVAARLYDSAPDSIMQILARRDASLTADVFAVYLDPYHDGRTGYYFAVTAAGSISDGTMYNDDWTENSWDGVWESGVKVDERGWGVEMRIPFSQLRFHEQQDHVWGINCKRVIGRKNEFDYMVYVPRNESGFVSRFGTLSGISSIAPGGAVEVLPYANTRAEYVRSAAGDPFRSGSKYIPGLGADVKVGLTSNLTLNATVNPDFGQVEVDPAVVNLSDVETYFSEKRPFFIEGASVFEFGYGGSNNFWGFNWSNPTIFYSRRIGRAPQGSLPSYDYADLPLGTHILGAGKLTGRVFDQWKIGTIHAVTKREFAEIQSSGQRSKIEIEPMTYYGIARIQRDFDEGRHGLGVITTYTQREFADARLRDQINAGAFVSGVDGWVFLDDEKKYVLTGWAAISNVHGSTTRLISVQRNSTHYFQRPDAGHVEVDSSAASLTGYAGRLMLNKQKGPVVLNAAIGAVHPKFDVNDMGFQGRSDVVNSHVVLGYKWADPTDYYRFLRVQGSTFANFDFGGNKIWHGYWMSTYIEHTNYHWTAAGFAYNPFTYDVRRTRGGPMMLTLPGREFWVELGSDSRKDVVVSMFGFTYMRTDEAEWQVQADVEWKPAPNISLTVGPYFGKDRTKAQWVTAVSDPLAVTTYGKRYIFATLHQTSVGASMRLNWTFSPQLSLQVYMQPLISVGDYHDFKELKAPRTFNFLKYGTEGSSLTDLVQQDGNIQYQADPDAAGPAPGFSFSNPDFNITSIRGNAVLRWEYRPGSTLYLVWTRSSFGYLSDGRFNFRRAFDRMIDTQTDNIFMVKFTYWFSM